MVPVPALGVPPSPSRSLAPAVPPAATQSCPCPAVLWPSWHLPVPASAGARVLEKGKLSREVVSVGAPVGVLHPAAPGLLVLLGVLLNLCL